MIEATGVNEAIAAIEGLYDEEEIADITWAVLHRLRYVAMGKTPVDTGAMRSAWVVQHNALFITPAAHNPRSGAPVTSYADVVSERVGVMDAVERRAPRLVEEEAQRYGYG